MSTEGSRASSTIGRGALFRSILDPVAFNVRRTCSVMEYLKVSRVPSRPPARHFRVAPPRCNRRAKNVALKADGSVEMMEFTEGFDILAWLPKSTS